MAAVGQFWVDTTGGVLVDIQALKVPATPLGVEPLGVEEIAR